MDVFATGHGSPSPEYGQQIVTVRRTRIVRASGQQDLARAATRWAFVSVPDGRPRRIPHEVSEAFRRAAVPAGGAGERVGP